MPNNDLLGYILLLKASNGTPLMEKRTPNCRLSTVKALIAQNKVRMTGTALAGAASLSLDATGILEVVNSLKTNDFYKSMTTHADHHIWQDVFKSATSG